MALGGLISAISTFSFIGIFITLLCEYKNQYVTSDYLTQALSAVGTFQHAQCMALTHSFFICLLENSQMGMPIISVARYLRIEEGFLSGPPMKGVDPSHSKPSCSQVASASEC